MNPLRYVRVLNFPLLRFVLALFIFAQTAVADDTAQVSIVVPPNSDQKLQFAGAELQRYVKSLFQIDAVISDAPAQAGFVMQLGVTKEGLRDQDFLLKPNGSELFITGGSPRAVLWAVYELVEWWGVRYLVHEDVLPASHGLMRFPTMEIKREPNMRTRCWRLVNDPAHGPVSWSLEENRAFLRQIAKMKFNRVVLSFWPCQPFVDYTFREMQKPPGTIYFGERYPIDNDTVGLEKFPGMTAFTNPELAGATSPKELTERAVALAHGIFAEAEKLGMETALLIQPYEWPKEFMAVLPGSEPATQLGGLTAGPGKDQSMNDPALRDMVATIFRAYVETYPEAEYIYVTAPEHRTWTEQAQQAYDALDKRYGIQALGSYEELSARARQRTSFPGGGERVETMLKGDLAGLEFLDSLIREKNLLARPNGRPDVKLVYCDTVEELFPLVAKMLPPGGEVLSFIDYTASRQLRQRDLLRQRPPEGLSASLTFTLADDNVGILPQLATGSLGELMTELRANNWNGYLARYWTVGDLNPTVHFLARASWNADLTPDAAYRDLVGQICGANAVEPVISALSIIEDITKGLDEHGLGFGFPVPGMMTKHYDAGGLPGDIQADRTRYAEALALLRTAREQSASAGHKFLDYLVGRLLFAVKYLDAAAHFGATAKAEKAGDRIKAAREIELAYLDIRDAIGSWANVAEDHGDLGAVALLNKHAYRPIRDKRNALAGGAAITHP
jgi:hypothetical protein